MADTNALELDGVRRAFGGVVAVDNVSIDVRRGEFVTLLGPSGSGKTSTLRLIGGFEQPDSGSIRINGNRVDHLPAYQRDTTTIFQSGALFPHKTVAENVAYGLRMRGVAKADIPPRVKQALEVVRLSGYEERYPAQLSGGQKQRVALARSMVVRPTILLFDEPLSALDLSLRLQLRAEIKRLHDEIGFSAIYVTHDQSEAMAMSSRVAVMRSGRIEQIDRPEKVFGEPANEFVYTFIGESCCLRTQISAGAAVDSNGAPIDLRLARRLNDGAWRIYIRPSRMHLDRTDMENGLRARLDFTEFLGDVHRYHFKAGKVELFVDHPGAVAHAAGDLIDIGWQTADMMAYQ
ncbi:ABC transporter ATP-binding protein [Pseudaminobacter soli (ex Li et al. 2025)]|uniref:ABC transporter ATP-binding protein n=1 Tax=Pseudaminobacter soli (ex Li et al. 2025) TaxID=1295366 RepID=UPI0024748B2C|nr:ABC transporter ATP-binding protein [Mesorhizobium soli]